MGCPAPGKVTENPAVSSSSIGSRDVLFPAMNTIRIADLLSLAVLLSGTLLFSQSSTPAKAPEFDHYAIHVRDLAKSADFYEKVIGLERIPDPFKDGRHIWFRMSAHNQLHVVAGATEMNSQPIDVHFALRVGSMANFTARLDKAQVKYRSFKGDERITTRPDGVHQTYLQDLDGYWIEINDGNY
ncbi:MAG TPA: VOC family protein [Terriglobales bacterium]|jgi:lactoylglutathione lyase|nr:VOC family protein [Terriglobales bacterium]